MSKRTSAMSDIKKGKNLERSLPVFAKDLSAVYGSSAILNLSMNYANYYVNTKEKEINSFWNTVFCVQEYRTNILKRKIE